MSTIAGVHKLRLCLEKIGLDSIANGAAQPGYQKPNLGKRRIEAHAESLSKFEPPPVP